MREMHRNCINALRDDGQMGSKVFGAVSELSRRNNSHRNVIATEMMVNFVKKTLDSCVQAKTWWECFSSNARCETLDQLIIVFDEVGKIPAFALGLVDEVRLILVDIQNKGLARNTMLVLVGSGLDGYIADSSPDFPLVTSEDFRPHQKR
jgi:hypothetical protein